MANRYIGKMPLEHKRRVTRERTRRHRAKMKALYGKTCITHKMMQTEVVT